MKTLLTAALALALAALLTGTASAFSHWPNAACPDSVTIHQILTPGTCQPIAGAAIPGDTVSGVGAVIVAIDAIPSSYSLYVQNNRADSTGYLSGADVFSGSRDYSSAPYNFAVGDSIVVEYGAVESFQGSWQLVSPSNSTQNPNIVVRKVSSGNRIPDPFLTTTTQLRTYETNTSAIPYLCSLVRINGPLKVARVNVTGTNNFYLVNPSVPSDSVYVQGSTLTTFASPPLGTPVDFVQGMFEHRTSTHYAIWLRSPADIGVSTPPTVTSAYAVADDQIRVLFDHEVTTPSATDVENYTLLSGAAVLSATMDGPAAVILTTDGTLPRGAAESLTCYDIVGLTNGLAMTTPQTAAFTNGVLSVREVAAPNPDSLLATPCVDRSRFAGPGGQLNGGLPGMIASFRGVCCGVFGSMSYYMDADRSTTGDHGGVAVYGVKNPVLGHQYLIVGLPQEYYGEVELYQIVSQSDQGTASLGAPIPLTVRTASRDTCEVSSAGGGTGYVPPSAVPSGQDFEGMLVQLDYVKRVVRRDLPAKPSTGFHVAGETPVFGDTMLVENLDGVLGASDSLNANYPPEGHVLTIVGVLHRNTGTFRLCPRSAADIIDHGANVSVPDRAPSLSFSVYPNPARHANLVFTLPRPARVDLGVYDVSGRRVATVWSGDLPAGRFSRAWNGRDTGGARTGAGLYFFRLRVDHDVRVARGILLGD